jgi:hypothetical protein
MYKCSNESFGYILNEIMASYINITESFEKFIYNNHPNMRRVRRIN